MKAHDAQNSYYLSEEIEIRKIFKTISPDSLPDYFTNLFNTLSDDIYAQARLVDIALRYEKNELLQVSAASKIGRLLEEHKILLIPAHIENASAQVAEMLSRQISSIRDIEPRMYFLKRFCQNKNPVIQQIYRAETRNNNSRIRETLQVRSKNSTIDIPQTKTNGQKKLHSSTKSHSPLHKKQKKIPSLSSMSENLIQSIATHICDEKESVRLMWIKRIGEIPKELDEQDTIKISFITKGINDQSIEVCLAAINQISFLIHDKSKLALLLKIMALHPELLTSSEATNLIKTLSSELQELYETNRRSSTLDKSRMISSAHGQEKVKEAKGNPSNNKRSEPESYRNDSAKNTEIPAGKLIVFPLATKRDPQNTLVTDTKQQVTQRTSTLIPNTLQDADELEEIHEILAELNLSDESFQELTNEKNPVHSLLDSIPQHHELQKIDNYFLRHTAVLHVKDLHAEELRYQLYQTVLKHDPKEIVRQAVVQESRNLETEHLHTIAVLGLKDTAWQVRCAVLEYLLPCLNNPEEQKNILALCAKDPEYHVRQKADEQRLLLGEPLQHSL